MIVLLLFFSNVHAAVISGRVLDSDGNPIAGLAVYAQSTNCDGGWDIWC